MPCVLAAEFNYGTHGDDVMCQNITRAVSLVLCYKYDYNIHSVVGTLPINTFITHTRLPPTTSLLRLHYQDCNQVKVGVAIS